MLRRAARLLTLLIVAAVMAAPAAFAQPAAGNNMPGTRQPRILLLVDASSSMLQAWGPSGTRFKTAGNIIGSLMDSIYAVNAGVEFGLRVYGHQSPAQNNDCFDTKQEVMFSKNNFTQMGLRLASITPFGVSPIAYSLQEAAANDLVDDARNAYSIILITDGGESCGGNICDVVKRLIERKIYFHPYIISLVDYAPLRDQYSCLGTFLQAAKPEDIPVAIRTIVDAYRPLLSAPIMAVKTEAPPPKPIPQEKPPVQVITVPAWIPEHTNLPDLNISIPARKEDKTAVSRPRIAALPLPAAPAVSKPVPEETNLPSLSVKPAQMIAVNLHRTKLYTAVASPRVAIVSKPPPEPVIVVRPRDTVVAALRPAAGHTLPIAPREAPKYLQMRAMVAVLPPVKEKEVQVALAALNPSAAKTATMPRYAPAIIPNSAPINASVARPEKAEKRDTVVAVKIAPPPPAKRDTATHTTIAIRKLDPPPKPAVKPVAVTTSTNKPKETSFTKETEDAAETSLSILFTDGRGKFYASTPQLQLLDAKSGKLVKQFYRTVDASGNPDPQVIPAGTYNLLVAGRANMLMRSVTVEPNKKNKVTVRVTNGSLIFRYDEAEGRPISEFEAIVNIRFEPGPTIRQRCTAELEYPPGNYYIEVNTMPISRYNADIDFGATTVIYLPQPGFVQFTNMEPKGKVTLYAPLGNKFVRFADLSITGSPAAQKLQLKPGAYEAHWVKQPGQPYASETVEHFNVQSNAVTEVELR